MKFALTLLLLMLLIPFPVPAANALDYDSFARIPIQHEGRIKPLDSFARASLRQFSGKDTVGGQPAIAWLAGTLFDPAAAIDIPVFRTFRPELLDLPPRKSRLYSFSELSEGLRTKSDAIEVLARTEQAKWSEDQKELMRLQENSMLYAQMLRSLSLVLPLDLSVPASLQQEWKIDAEKPFSLNDAAPFEDELARRVRMIVRKKGEDPARYTDEEKAVAAFAYNLGILKRGGETNILFRVIPAKQEWLSPWSARATPETSDKIGLWEEASHAYLSGQADEFARITSLLSQEADAMKVSLEITYNSYHPLGVATILYFASFLFFAAHALWQKRYFYTASLTALAVATGLNIVTILARIVILERPPVGTLYESVIFVAALCALVALIMEMRRKDGGGLLAGSLSGLLLLFTAQGFSGDDTMQVLVAVLNTNFWLATHVLCITTGYAICLLAAIFAHLQLFGMGQGRDIGQIRTATRTLGLAALLFTTVGTILGGIWADQSWGRFWGWDPKENGALLIVLWLVWVYHGQLSGHIKGPAFAAGIAALSIVVALAWFGVNLLNVGLHSYGFITGVAGGLAAFCAIETAIIGALWWRAHQCRKGRG